LKGLIKVEKMMSSSFKWLNENNNLSEHD